VWRFLALILLLVGAIIGGLPDQLWVVLDDTNVLMRCFPHVTVGLEMHRELTIVLELDLGGDSPWRTLQHYSARHTLARGRPRLLLVRVVLKSHDNVCVDE
jgi:hypothetical protein